MVGDARAPQRKEPAVLLQPASGSQGAGAAAHSFTSAHVTPSPCVPGGHGPQRKRTPAMLSAGVGLLHTTPAGAAGELRFASAGESVSTGL